MSDRAQAALKSTEGQKKMNILVGWISSSEISNPLSPKERRSSRRRHRSGYHEALALSLALKA